MNDLYLNIDNRPLIFNREKYHRLIEEILKNPRVDILFNYIASNKENDVTLNKRTPLIQMITYAVKTIGLSYTAGKKHSGLFLERKDHFKIQQLKVKNYRWNEQEIQGGLSLLRGCEVDDYLYWSNDERVFSFTKVKYLPKIT